MQQTQTFNMHEFCSRKLWEMVSAEAEQGHSDLNSPEELMAAVRELGQRRHYLSELEELGKLNQNN